MLGCDSCRQKNTLATFRNRKHRGLSFRLRIVVFSLQEHRPSRKQTKSRQIIRLRLTYFQQQRTNVRASMRRQTTDCCFPSHIYSNLTYATALATPLSVGRMTTDATECFSIYRVSGRKDLSFSQFHESGILYSCNGALNAFPLLEYYHVSKL